MTSRKIRAFLDTNVLLEYFAGKAELQHLFSEDVRELKGMIERPRKPVSVEDMRKAVARRAGR